MPFNFILRSKLIVVLEILIFSLAVKKVNSEVRCSLDDPNSCSFGGTCKTLHGIERTDDYDRFLRRVFGFSSGDQVCHCNGPSCYEHPKELLCDSNMRTYFNKWCLHLEECKTQTSIVVQCKGDCRHNCINITNQDRLRFCIPGETSFCRNNGFCVQHPFETYYSFCRCANGFRGIQCELNDLQNGDNSQGSLTNNSKFYQVGFNVFLSLFIIVFVCTVFYVVVIKRRQ